MIKLIEVQFGILSNIKYNLKIKSGWHVHWTRHLNMHVRPHIVSEGDLP